MSCKGILKRTLTLALTLAIAFTSVPSMAVTSYASDTSVTNEEVSSDVISTEATTDASTSEAEAKTTVSSYSKSLLDTALDSNLMITPQETEATSNEVETESTSDAASPDSISYEEITSTATSDSVIIPTDEIEIEYEEDDSEDIEIEEEEDGSVAVTPNDYGTAFGNYWNVDTYSHINGYSNAYCVSFYSGGYNFFYQGKYMTYTYSDGSTETFSLYLVKDTSDNFWQGKTDSDTSAAITVGGITGKLSCQAGNYIFRRPNNSHSYLYISWSDASNNLPAIANARCGKTWYKAGDYLATPCTNYGDQGVTDAAFYSWKDGANSFTVSDDDPYNTNTLYSAHYSNNPNVAEFYNNMGFTGCSAYAFNAVSINGAGSCTVTTIRTYKGAYLGRVIRSRAVYITDYDMSTSNMYLWKGGTDTRKMTLTGEQNATVTYASSSPSVATVDSSGKVTAKGSGTTTITATATGKNGEGHRDKSYKVYVSNWDMSTAAISMYTADTNTTRTMSVNTSYAYVEYSSSVPSLVSVNNGTLTSASNKTGTAIITAKAIGKNGLTGSKTLTYTVQVNPRPFNLNSSTINQNISMD